MLWSMNPPLGRLQVPRYLTIREVARIHGFSDWKEIWGCGCVCFPLPAFLPVTLPPPWLLVSVSELHQDYASPPRRCSSALVYRKTEGHRRTNQVQQIGNAVAANMAAALGACIARAEAGLCTGKEDLARFAPGSFRLCTPFLFPAGCGSLTSPPLLVALGREPRDPAVRGISFICLRWELGEMGGGGRRRTQHADL